MHMLLKYTFAMAAIVAMTVSLAALVVPVAAGSIADHVVISEVELVDSEWVELYNPTDTAVNMSSWYWCYYESGKDWNQPSRERAFFKASSDLSIDAYRFYLMRIHGTVENADWDSGFAGEVPTTLNDSAGSLAIFPWDPAEKTAAEAEAGRIDAVAWGAVSFVKEGSEAGAPGSGMSLQRRVNNTITFDGFHGPGWDTDNNAADFFIAAKDPRSSHYSPVPPIPELAPLILFATGLCTFAGYMLIARRSAR
jgi:hypothetical protein